MISCVIRGKGVIMISRYSLLSPLFEQTISKKRKRRAWGERSFSMEVRELKNK